MSKIECKNCLHLREAPYQANITGCWHPDHMQVTQKAAYLDQQQQPGDHRRINLRGDCAQFEERPSKPSIWQRLLRRGA